MRLLDMSGLVKATIEAHGHYSARINHLGDDPRAVLIQHYYVRACPQRALPGGGWSAARSIADSGVSRRQQIEGVCFS